MPSIASAYKKSLAAGAKATTLKARQAFAFDETNPEATRWAEQHAAELVTAIAEDARATIRLVVREGFTHGVSPRQIAANLRATIGLTERDAQAVMTRQLKLVERGVEAEKATSAAERYATTLRNTRVMTIARTETMRAANEGQLQLWRQAQGAGMLPLTAMKEWITADPCPLCAPLNGEQVLVDQDFSVGTDPPLHVRCRCTIGLVV